MMTENINEELNTIFGKYIKFLKLKVDEDYIYIRKYNDTIFMFALNQAFIKCLYNVDIPEQYINKMISVKVIKNATIGNICDLGVIDSFDFVDYYNCNVKYHIAMSEFDNLIMRMSNQISSFIANVNLQDEFINNIMSRKAADGAGRFKIDDRHLVIIAPNMVPLTKTSSLDINIYDADYYFTCNFIVHKPKGVELMISAKFLYV